jgi:hypothetical protein
MFRLVAAKNSLLNFRIQSGCNRLNICRHFLFFVSLSAYAQFPIDFGIKGGVSLTDAYRSSSSGPFGTSSNAKDYIVGPFLDLRLVKDIGVEADALFRPVDFVSFARVGDILSVSRFTTWEFPILAKYRFRLPFPILRPTIEAGPSFRAHARSAPGLTASGFTAGGGVELKLPVIRLSSDLRYTRWQSPGSPTSTSPELNQVELLFGISF